MRFQNALVGLSDQAILVFKNVTLKMSELRYALDLANSQMAEAMMTELQAQEIEIDLGRYTSEGQWSRVNSPAWFQQGIACDVLQPDVPVAQPGRLKLKIQLEFCPDDPENSDR